MTVMTMLSTIVDVDTLWQTVWSATVAGVGVSVIFALTVLGATRSADHRRSGRTTVASAYGLLGLAGFAATVGAIVWGILLITT